jgi:hypothetical protein
VLGHRAEARRTVGSLERRCDHHRDEAVGGGGDRGQLQVELRAEVGEEAALAHPQIGGEAADRQALEALDRGEVDGATQDRGAGPLSFRPARFRPLGCTGHADRIEKHERSYN